MHDSQLTSYFYTNARIVQPVECGCVVTRLVSSCVLKNLSSQVGVCEGRGGGTRDGARPRGARCTHTSVACRRLRAPRGGVGTGGSVALVLRKSNALRRYWAGSGHVPFLAGVSCVSFGLFPVCCERLSCLVCHLSVCVAFGLPG